mmetsp:Transcript_10741/g.37429  ORF Transcript_10741/g.37429 Transcript_10741/m.37429 type:complete len:131 (+) Transcript_10741:482-874(+)
MLIDRLSSSVLSSMVPTDRARTFDTDECALPGRDDVLRRRCPSRLLRCCFKEGLRTRPGNTDALPRQHAAPMVHRPLPHLAGRRPPLLRGAQTADASDLGLMSLRASVAPSPSPPQARARQTTRRAAPVP